MSQALYTSKTGITAGQTQIDVIANNVANINTTGYKTANVTFSTLFSKTLSNGSAATATGGGTNPKQIGLGTQVAGITRDFSTGAFQSTGISSDMMISGNGYFVVQDGTGTQYFTRDGSFSLDNEGNLVTSAGMKVCGTSSAYSTVAAQNTVVVPTMLNVSINGTAADKISNTKLGEMNAVSISTGSFKINVGGTSTTVEADRFAAVSGSSPQQYKLYTDSSKTTEVTTYTKMDMANLSSDDRQAMTELFGTLSPSDTYYKGGDGTYIKGEIPTASGSFVAVRNKQQTLSYNITDSTLNTSLQDFVTDANASFATQRGDTKIKLTVIDGGLQLTNTSGESLTIPDDQTSNFLVTTGLKDAVESAESGQTVFYGSTMNESATISNAYNSSSALKRSDWTISEGGVLTADYNDGSSLTVKLSGSTYLWEYTTSDNVVISSSGATGTDLDMTATGLVPANMILQMGTVVNNSGLIAQADNLWTIGPDAGEFAYGTANGNGFGSLKSGGLEGSNVDMATELSNMITAQRAIQVNSRVFSTASSILETLAYLGQ